MSEKDTAPALEALGAGGTGLSSTLRVKPVPQKVNKQYVRAASGRVVGEVLPGGIFQKHVQHSKHYLSRPGGWCWDVASLREAESLGARVVEVLDTESGRAYRTTFDVIRRRGFGVNRGFGEQRGLELRWFDAQSSADAPAEQLALFEVAA